MRHIFEFLRSREANERDEGTLLKLPHSRNFRTDKEGIDARSPLRSTQFATPFHGKDALRNFPDDARASSVSV